MYSRWSLAVFVSLSSFTKAQSLMIPAGPPVEFTPGAGVVEFDDLTIPVGATLRLRGTAPAHVRVRGTLRVDGKLDASGDAAASVNYWIYAATAPKPGYPGGPGGGSGGTSNPMLLNYCVAGGDGADGYGIPFGLRGGGGGGESVVSTFAYEQARGAGGGGGAFGPDLPPIFPDPSGLLNFGRIAKDGQSGGQFGLGAAQHLPVVAGGKRGLLPFIDDNPDNDFWGRKIDPITSQVIVGELSSPRGGSGGGAGGNRDFDTYPSTYPWSPIHGVQGGIGGGGGGLLILQAQLVVVGATGRILVDGGDGDGGMCTSGVNNIGGSGGGGSGGMLVLQARRIDLTSAAPACITAIGGQGGGAYFLQHGHGGDGGPGLVQFHVSNGAADVRLPVGKTLADMTVPNAHLLVPEPNL